MNDKLKLSFPHGDAELDRIASALETNENRKRYEQLKKNIHDLERLIAEREQAVRKTRAPAKANNKIGARKEGVFKAVSSAPSFNRTPVGPAMVPLPYPTTIDLSNSAGVASSVRFNGKQVYTLASSQANCKGDEKGSGGGVKSGTVNGEVKPTGASTTVRVEGKRVVRDGDPCTMNGGNNPGIYVTVPPTSGAAPRDALASSNPPVKLETPAEESRFKKWLHHTADTVKAAIASPGEGLIGAAKGIGNIPSNIAELLLSASMEQGAAEMEQAAMSQALFGLPDDAKKMMVVAAETRKQGLPFEVPKFTMNNPAQEGGDTISTAVQLFAGGVGIVKGAARGAAALGETGAAARASGAGARVTRDALKTADIISDAKAVPIAAERAGDGLRVLGRSESSIGSFGKVPESIKTSSGIPIKPIPGKTTTVLGSFRPDMRNIISEQLEFPKTLDFGEKTGGFNALNVPDELVTNSFWDDFNKPFLDAAIERGDEIAIATKPEQIYLIRQDGTITGFGQEMIYLRERGFSYDASKSKMIKLKGN
jgi:hypothetical protein